MRRSFDPSRQRQIPPAPHGAGILYYCYFRYLPLFGAAIGLLEDFFLIAKAFLAAHSWV